MQGLTFGLRFALLHWWVFLRHPRNVPTYQLCWYEKTHKIYGAPEVRGCEWQLYRL